MERVSCEAVVIGGMDYREADRIVTLFTLEHGVLRALARGAKRSTRRFAGALELFAHLSLRLVLKEGLCTLEEADAVTIFPAIRQDFAKIGLASYACELVAALLPEGMANRRVFRLVIAYLLHLGEGPASLSDRRFFEINLLNILGYRPPLEECAGCGERLAADGGRWHQGAAGIYCRRCSPGGERLSAATLDQLRRSLGTGRFGQIRLSPAELAEAGALLDAAIGSCLPRPLQSLAFLRLSP
jgi:DNA repair protein RecO (recombination protein O)